MPPDARPLRLYGAPSAQPALPWAWAEQRLTEAGLYWVDIGAARPHPRPVWGVWHDEQLALSLGSPVLRARAETGADVTVHLPSAVEVVVVEGVVHGHSGEPALVGAYDEKYSYRYDLEQYGPLLVIAPREVLAWRVSGRSGVDGFQAVGHWTFGTDEAR